MKNHHGSETRTGACNSHAMDARDADHLTRQGSQHQYVASPPGCSHPCQQQPPPPPLPQLHHGPATPLSIDTGFSGDVLSPLHGTVACLDPTSTSPSQRTSLPLRSPKRKITYDFQSDMSSEQFDEIHRNIMKLAGPNVKVVEEQVEEDEEEPIPFIHLQDPPKSKFKRQLSSDSNSPPEQLMTSRGFSTPGSKSRDPTDVQMQHLLVSSPRDALSNQMGVVSVLSPREKEVPLHQRSPVISALSRSAPAADVGLLMGSAMSPKRLKSEHGSILCTPTRSPMMTSSAQASFAHVQAEVVHTISPSRPKSGKNSDIVFVFPELHKDESEGEEDEDGNNTTTNNNDNGKDFSSGDLKTLTPGQTMSGHTSLNKTTDENDSGLKIKEIRQTSCSNQTQAETTSDIRAPSGVAYDSSSRKLPELQQRLKQTKTLGSLQMLQILKEQKASEGRGLATAPSLARSQSVPAVEATSTRMLMSSRASPDTVHVLSNKEERRREAPKQTITRHTEHAEPEHEPIETRTPPLSADRSPADPDRCLELMRQARQKKILADKAYGVLSLIQQKHIASLTPRLEDPREYRGRGPAYPERDLWVEKNGKSFAEESHLRAKTNAGRTAESADYAQGALSLDQSQTRRTSMHQSASAPNLQQEAQTSEFASSESFVEEESRTARLCRAKDNPFTFTEKEIQKAQQNLLTEHSRQNQPGGTEVQQTQLGAALRARLGQPVPQQSTSTDTRPDVQNFQEKGVAEHRSFSGADMDKVSPVYHGSSGNKESTLPSRQFSEPGNWNRFERLHDSHAKEAATVRQYSEPGTTLGNHSRHVAEMYAQLHPSQSTTGLSVWPEGQIPFSPSRASNDAVYRDVLRSNLQAGFCPQDRGEDEHRGFTFHSFRYGFEKQADNQPLTVVGPSAGNAGASSARREVDRQEAFYPRHQTTLQRSPSTYSQLSPNSYPSLAHTLHPLSPNRHPASTYPAHPTMLHYRPLEEQPPFVDSDMLPRQHPYLATDDDGVFVDSDFRTPYSCGTTPQFRSPSLSPHQIRAAFSAARLGTPEDRASAESTPKRPALRSQSNVEQSPNQAELDEMAPYKFLRSYSEHTSDPVRLMEQMKMTNPKQYARIMECLGVSQAQPACGQRNATLGADEPQHYTQHGAASPAGARRQLFGNAPDPDAGAWSDSSAHARALDLVEGCHTYPPPFWRRQSFSSTHHLRRAVSWIPDREGEGGRRVRETGDLDVRIHCTNASPFEGTSSLDHEGHHPEHFRRRIETYLQQILQSHLQQRPTSASQAEMQQWMAQYDEIDKLTQEASQLISKLTEHNRSIYDVTTGSVVIRLNCPTLLSVLDLGELVETGVLQGMVGSIFGGDKMRTPTGLHGVELRVTLCEKQFRGCLEELGAALLQQSPQRLNPQQHFPSLRARCKVSPLPKREIRSAENLLQIGTPPRSPLHVTECRSHSAQELMTSSPLSSPRSPSTPSKRERKFSYGDNSTRKAFSELNLSDGDTPATSPTKRKSFFGPSLKENSILSPFAASRLRPSALLAGGDDCVFDDDVENNNCVI